MPEGPQVDGADQLLPHHRLGIELGQQPREVGRDQGGAVVGGLRVIGEGEDRRVARSAV